MTPRSTPSIPVGPPGIDPATDMRYSDGQDPMEARPTPVEPEAHDCPRCGEPITDRCWRHD